MRFAVNWYFEVSSAQRICVVVPHCGKGKQPRGSAQLIIAHGRKGKSLRDSEWIGYSNTQETLLIWSTWKRLMHKYWNQTNISKFTENWSWITLWQYGLYINFWPSDLPYFQDPLIYFAESFRYNILWLEILVPGDARAVFWRVLLERRVHCSEAEAG